MIDRNLNRQKEMKKKEKDTRRHKCIEQDQQSFKMGSFKKYATVEGG